MQGVAHHVKGASSNATAKVQHTVPWPQVKRLDKLLSGVWASRADISFTKDLLVTGGGGEGGGAGEETCEATLCTCVCVRVLCV